MNKHIDDHVSSDEEVESVQSLQPFILGFLEKRDGAVSCTTSGTFDNCDGADVS